MKNKLKIIIAGVLVVASTEIHARQVGNIDADDKTIERVTITYDGKVIAWDKMGYILPGFPVGPSGKEFVLSPRLSDVDMDEKKDVLAVTEDTSGNQEFHVFNGKGEEIPYLKFSIQPSGAKVTATPIIADVTGDGIYEIAYGTKAGEVKVLMPDFVSFSGFQGLNVGGEPVVYTKDTDNDGVEELFAKNDNKIYRWNTPDTRVELFSGARIKGDISLFDLDFDRRYEVMFATNDNHIHISDYSGTPVLDVALDREKIVGPPVPADADLDGEWEVLVPTNAQKLRAFEVADLISSKALDPSYTAGSDAYVASWDYTISYRGTNFPTIDTVADDTYIASFLTSLGYDQGIVYRSRIGYSSLEYGEFAHQYDLLGPLELVDFVKITDVISHPAVFTPDGNGINDTVTISYRLSQAAEVSLVITDLRHFPLATVVQGVTQGLGENRIVWDGKLPDGKPAATGNYIGKIKAKNPDGVITTANANIVVNGIKAQIEKPYDPNVSDSVYPRIYGIVSIEGVAIDPNIGEGNDNADFISYNLYYKKGAGPVNGNEAVLAGTAGDTIWMPLIVPLVNQCTKDSFLMPNDSRYPFSNVSCRPIQHGLLGYFDTTKVPNAIYTILLKAMDSNGNDPKRASFDAVTVNVQNPSATLPYDATNPYSMNNPANPLYQNPVVNASATMSGPTISNATPTMDITFSTNETSDVEIIIYQTDATCTDTGPVVFVKEFDKATRDQLVNFQWDGTTPLGRRVTGGWYQLVMIATAVDGSGFTELESRCFEVARGFASSDILAINSFDVTPGTLFLANNLNVGGIPEHVSLRYELSKYANATIELFDADPSAYIEDAGWKTAHLVKLVVKDKFAISGAFAWYGERASGSLVTDLNTVYALLTGVSIDQGNSDTKYATIAIPVMRPEISGEVAAALNSLTGQKEGAGFETVTKVSDRKNLVGDSSFHWLAWGRGHVELDLRYSFRGTSDGQRWAACNNSRKSVPLLACAPPEVCSGDKKGCSSPSPHPITTEAELSVGSECQVTEFGSEISGAPSDIEDMSFKPKLIRKEHDIPNPECKLHQPGCYAIMGQSMATCTCQGIIKDGKWYIPEPFITQVAYIKDYPNLIATKVFSWDRSGNTLDSPQFNESGYDPFTIWYFPIFGGLSNMLSVQKDPEDPGTYQPAKLRYRAQVSDVDGDYTKMQAVCSATGRTVHCAEDPNMDEDPFNDVDASGNPIFIQPTDRFGRPTTNIDSGYDGVEYRCGSLSVYYLGRTRKSCSYSTSTGTTETTITSDQNEVEIASYNASLEGCNSPYQNQYIPDTSSNKVYNAYVSAKANGNWTGRVNVGTSPTAIAGLASAKKSSSAPPLKLYAQLPFHPYWTNQHDPYLGYPVNAQKAPDRKIRGYIDNFNSTEFNIYSDFYNIFGTYKAQGYITPPQLGYNLYSFSDAVRIDEWFFEFRYPNESPAFPKGELMDGVFEPNSVSVFNSGETKTCPTDPCPPNSIYTVSNNIYDNFRLRFLPNAVPKRFVRIYGSATPNYKLYYFDSDETDPKWVEIPAKATSAVSGGLLGTWDVTSLNGEHYTVVLRSPSTANPVKFNQDYISVGIGELVQSGRYARVFTPFKRASLIFDPNTLQGVNKDLITINQVKHDSADFKLPSGIVPLGPIFDIKPDDIQIDPNYPVELNFVFTKDELVEMFGIGRNDYSKITIYNLKADGVLEPIATLRLENCSHPDPENYGIHDGCLRQENDKIRFTGLLNHFSSYIIAKEGPVIPKITSPLIYPRPDGWDTNADPSLTRPVDEYLYSGTVPFDGRLEDANGRLTTPASLTVRYYPKDNNAQMSGSIYSNTNTTMSFDFNTKAPNLNGEYVLRFDTTTSGGIAETLDLPMLIDNSPPVSTLRFNGVTVNGQGPHMVNIYSVIELTASDVLGNVETSGVQKIEYRFNQSGWNIYNGPFTLVNPGLGLTQIEFRATDNAGNVEVPKLANLEVVDVNAQAQNARLSGVLINTEGSQYSDGSQTWVNDRTRFYLVADGTNFTDLEYEMGDGVHRIYEDGFTLGDQEGFYVLDYFATDDFGARGERNTKRMILDKTPPITTYEFGSHYLVTERDVFVDEGTTLSLSAVDGGLVPSGVRRIEYNLDGGGWQRYGDPILFKKTAILCIRAIDNVDNREVSPAGDECAHRLSIRYDDVMPATISTASVDAFSPNGDSVNDDVLFEFYNSDNFAEEIYVTLTVAEEGGGQEYVLVDNERNPPGEFKYVWDGSYNGSILPEARYTYTFSIRDEKGNLSNVEKGEIVLDVTPPKVSLIGSSRRLFSPNRDGLAEILQVDYSVSDNLLNESLKSGLIVLVGDVEIFRQIGTTSVPPYQKSLTWNGLSINKGDMPDGDYSYTIYAEDRAGNKTNEVFSESSVRGSVSIDRTPPVSDLKVTGRSYTDSRGVVWLGEGAKIGLTSFDPMPGTGVDLITYSIDGAPDQFYVLPIGITEPGPHTIRFGATDRIGNKEETNIVELNFDNTPPESQITVSGVSVNDPNLGVIVSRDTTITLESLDGGVGVSEGHLMLAGRPYIAIYEGAIHLTDLEEGKYTIEYWSDDLVGNSEGVKKFDIYYDARPPVTRLLIGNPQYKVGELVYINKDTPITFEIDSNRDDKPKGFYRLDGGEEKEVARFTIESTGEHTITYSSRDNLLNVEEVKSKVLYVDNDPPTTTISSNNMLSSGANSYFTAGSIITLDAKDAASGVRKIEYRWGDAAYEVYSSPFTVPATLGMGTLGFRGIDNLGQVEGEHTLNIGVQGLEVTRIREVVPRTLVIMLQSIDLRDTDPRPNENLLKETLSTIDGFYEVMPTDKYSFSDIINKMMNGMYNIFVIATDANVVRWDDRKEVDILLSMIQAFVHNGDSLVMILKGASSEGRLWESFISSISGHLEGTHFGKGAVINIEGDPGRSSDPEAERQKLKDVILASVPPYREPSRGDVTDVRLVISNNSDFAVKAGVEVKGDVKVLSEGSGTLELAAHASDNMDYLAYLGKDEDSRLIGEKITAQWSNGLVEVYEDAGEKITLLDPLWDRISKLYDRLYYEQDPSIAGVTSNLKELYYSLPKEDVKDIERLDWTLAALKAVGDDKTYEDIRYELETILRLMCIDMTISSDDGTVVNYSDSPTSNLGEDTTQYGGEGGCILLGRGEIFGIVAMFVVIMSLIIIMGAKRYKGRG